MKIPSAPPWHASCDDQIRAVSSVVSFQQRVRVGEFIACPKSKVRLHRLQQWRHHYKEILLKPAPGLKVSGIALFKDNRLQSLLGDF